MSKRRSAFGPIGIGAGAGIDFDFFAFSAAIIIRIAAPTSGSTPVRSTELAGVTPLTVQSLDTVTVFAPASIEIVDGETGPGVGGFGVGPGVGGFGVGPGGGGGTGPPTATAQMLDVPIESAPYLIQPTP